MSIEEIGLAISIIFAHPVSFAVEGAVFLSGPSDPDAVKFFNAVNVVANKTVCKVMLCRSG